MIKRLQRPMSRVGAFSAVVAERYMPDAWIYAVLLTFIAFIAALALTPSTPWQVLSAWQNDLWNKDILVLIAQFSVNLILCTTMAKAPPVQRALIRLAAQPSSATSAIALIALVSIALSLVSWALCIVGGALFAQEACRQAKRKRIRLHYPLAIATGYVGMMTWGCGLTSSAPLISATENHPFKELIGVIPVAQTLGSTTNLFILVLLVTLCPIIMAAMHPTPDKKEKVVEFAPPEEREAQASTGIASFADRLEMSPALLKLAALFPLSYLVSHYFLQGKGITIDSMNLLFLVIVMLLYRTPREMLWQVSRASDAVWSIVFQFPFYAGLMGLIKGTGLGLVIAQFFADVSTPLTWPTIGLASQAFLNIFIPSGGTQWIVTAEILVKTSQALGFSPAYAILIEVMGDQVANMITPMWALPALALTGLRARDIMGYTAIVMMFGFVVMAVGLTLFRF